MARGEGNEERWGEKASDTKTPTLAKKQFDKATSFLAMGDGELDSAR